MNPRKFLAADIGATHTRLILCNSSGSGDEEYVERHYCNDQFADFETLLAAFADGCTDITSANACFAVAGPIHGHQAKMTNRAWQIDAHLISQRFALTSLRLVNDFFAAAIGVTELSRQHKTILQTGLSRPDTPCLVIGPGTGLGVAFIIGGTHVFPSEGGHIGFAPQDDWQRSLLQHLADFPGPLQQAYGPSPVRVNVERLLSGSGLIEIYRYLCLNSGAMAIYETSRQIVEVAQKGLDERAQQTVERFTSILGAVCGDLALAFLAYRGVVLVGSIANSLLSWLTSPDGPFLMAFNAKAEHEAVVRAIPVSLMTADEVGLHGALAWAKQQAIQ